MRLRSVAQEKHGKDVYLEYTKLQSTPTRKLSMTIELIQILQEDT